MTTRSRHLGAQDRRHGDPCRRHRRRPGAAPDREERGVVIRSPHKYKDSREHFEMRTHKRLIDIIDPTPKAVDSLMRLDLPPTSTSRSSSRGQQMSMHNQDHQGTARHQARHDPGLGREQQARPRTVIEIAPNVVTQVRTVENDGYIAVQIAYGADRPAQGQQACRRPLREGWRHAAPSPHRGAHR